MKQNSVPTRPRLRPFVLVTVLAVVLGLQFKGAGLADAAKYKPVIADTESDHDRFGTRVVNGAGEINYRREFRAYITVFDGEDDDNGDGLIDLLGVPHFVAYQIRRYEGVLPKGPKRPSSWITEETLWKAGIAPRDASYRYSVPFRKNNPNWYVRGHLCMKQHAWRLGAAADWNTHTMLNSVPQRQDFNAGLWLDLEKLTAEWADAFGAVWIIAGPVFEPRPNTPRAWLGEPEKGEIPVAIPDALFKIVIRESENPDRPDVLAFIYPQDVAKGKPYDHTPFMTTVDVIERKTGIDFLTVLPDAIESEIEAGKPENLWVN